MFFRYSVRFFEPLYREHCRKDAIGAVILSPLMTVSICEPVTITSSGDWVPESLQTHCRHRRILFQVRMKTFPFLRQVRVHPFFCIQKPRHTVVSGCAVLGEPFDIICDAAFTESFCFSMYSPSGRYGDFIIEGGTR